MNYSLRRIGAIAAITWVGFVRSKAFYGLFFVACVLIGCALFLAKFSAHEELQLFQDLSLGMIALFLNSAAIVATALLLPQEEMGQLLMILAKPIARWEYLLGKLLGIFLLLLVSACLMGTLFFLMLFVQEWGSITIMQQAMRGQSPQELASALAIIKGTISLQPLLAALAMILMKSWLLASMTLLISTIATTPLFTIMVATAVYAIGHLQSSVRELWLHGGLVNWWCRGVLALVTLLLPDLSAFNGSDHFAGGVTVSWVLFLSMLALGCTYTICYYLLACFLFQRKEF